MKTFARCTLAMAAVAGALSLWPMSGAAQTREFVVATWGDPYEPVWRKSVVEPFEKANNVKIVWSAGGSLANVAKMVAQKDKPEIDVALMDDGPHQQAVIAGLVEKIDRSKLTTAKHLIEFAAEPGDMGIGFGMDGTILWYNKDIFAKNKWPVPTSWLDLYKPEYKGKVLAHHITNGNGICLLVGLNRIGGSHESKSMDAGFAKVKELASQVVMFDRYGETPGLIQQGTAALGTLTVSRTVNLAKAGAPLDFVYPKEGVCAFKQVATIVKGRPNQDLAYKFIDAMLSKSVQEDTAKNLGMGPMNSEAKLDAETAKGVIYGEATKKVWSPDWKAINAGRTEWTERWGKEVERK